jgi:serine/threonine-protein kinase
VADSERAGEMLAGRYELCEVIGRGAAAVVYRARDRRHDRDVAVKVLRAELTQSLTADRFIREIGIAAKLTHPHILPLYDSGEANGQFYYVTPFIQGESLRQHLEHVPQLNPRESVVLAHALASALECAHAQGIVHRDLKPENVLLVSGQALLSDFGIAQVLRLGEDPQRFTLTGLVVGTPQYMSPEQAAGSGAVDARSDIYSLGCMLYEMLTGEAPFHGDSVQAIIARRFTEDAPNVRERRGEVPRALADLVASMLAREPAERVQTASELVQLLAAVEVECATLSGSTYAKLANQTIASTRRRLRRVRGLAWAGGVAVVVAGAWLARDVPWIGALLHAGPSVKTLAVLPLVNLSGDVQQEFFADGLTAALIADLTQLPGVKVISRTSVMQYKLMKKPLRNIARELHADALLEGTMMREGEQVRITATLVRGSDEQSLWTRTFDGQAGQLFELQRAVGADVAREIGARFAPGAGAKRRSVKPESQQAYLKGAYYAGQSRLEEAIASFMHAVAVDPSNAPAYAAMSRAFYFRAFFGQVAPQEAFSQMRRAAAAALAQDPSLGEAHGLMALVNTHFDYDWPAAEKHFAQALALSPSNAQVHHDYAHFLLAMGRGAESVEESRRAVELDPANPMLTACLGWHSLFDARYDESLRQAAEAQRMMPSFWARIVQGWAEEGKEEHAKAVASMRGAMELEPTLGFTQSALAYALAHNGETREARTLLAGLLAQSRVGYVSAYDIALVYTGLGDTDAAFEWLGKAIAERSMFVVHLAWDARLRPLRDDRRFRELLDRLAIPGQSARATKPKTVAMARRADTGG